MESNAQAIRVVAHLRFDDDHELPASRAYIDGVLGRGSLRSGTRRPARSARWRGGAARRALGGRSRAVRRGARAARVGDEPVDATAAVAQAAPRGIARCSKRCRRTASHPGPADDEAFLVSSPRRPAALGGRAPRGRTCAPPRQSGRRPVPRARGGDARCRRPRTTAHGAACLLLPADPAFAARARRDRGAPPKRWVERATGDTVRPRTGARASTSSCQPCASTRSPSRASRRLLRPRACRSSRSSSSSTSPPSRAARATVPSGCARARGRARGARRGGLYVRVLDGRRARPRGALRIRGGAPPRYGRRRRRAGRRPRGARAEWCVLLDDDMEPAPDLLYRYADAAHAAGGDAACVGLAGLTVFRDAGDRFSRAARSLGMVVNFDNAATWADDPGRPPWAPTANLMVRRVWPGQRRRRRSAARGGRGALRRAVPAQRRRRGRRARGARAGRGPAPPGAPGAVAAHDLWPWRGQLARACRWGRATALLAVAHPRHVKRRLPNAVEWTAGALAYGLARAPRRAPAYALAVLLGRFSALAVRQHRNAVENERLNSHLPLAERVEMGGGVGCAGAWARFVVHGLLRASLVLASACGDVAGAAALVPTFVASGFDGRYLFFGRAFDYTLGARAQKPRGRADVVTDVASVAGMLAFIVLLGEWVL